MWDAFFAKRNFYNKCKSALRMINMRLEIITKKRSAMQKFLKNDVADLLRSNYHHNAYGKAEVVYMEMNLSWCYNYVQECCTLITNNLKLMETEMECPEECRIAAASMAYAAARFADLPELRDLRTLFTNKYGNALDAYVNKEFVEKLKANPPTREAKIQVMKEVAEEFSISWNPSSFEQNMKVSDGGGGGGYKEADDNQTRPAYTNNSNVLSSPYVKLKNKNGEDEESEMDRLLRHHSMRTWMRTRGDPTESPSASSGPYGRSVSMYTNHNNTANHMHPKLPEYDELASRIQALRKM
ncbi:hypothetical protein V2J09_005459 [Rumex salicifolius]